MSHLMLQELESNAPRTVDGQRMNKPGFEVYGRTSWQALRAKEEMDYVQDIEYLNRCRHRREMDEMNAKRKAANAKDRLSRRFGKGQ